MRKQARYTRVIKGYVLQHYTGDESFAAHLQRAIAGDAGKLLSEILLTGEMDQTQPIYVKGEQQAVLGYPSPMLEPGDIEVEITIQYGVRRDESHDLDAGRPHTAPTALEGQKAIGSSHFTGIDITGVKHEGAVLNVWPLDGAVLIEYQNAAGRLVAAEFSPTAYKLGA